MTSRARTRSPIEPEIDADSGLIRRCLGGDTQAWADLYLRYRTPLYALCLSWTRDHAFAEDVVHDAFVKAFEQMKTFDQERRFFPWLAAIAKNRVHDVRRQGRGLVQVEMPDDSVNGAAIDSTMAAVMDGEERKRVHNALAALPPTQRTALLLSELGGLSYAQIAQSVGASESAVKSLIFRARVMLRRSLRPLATVFGLRALKERLGAGVRRASAVASRVWLDPAQLNNLGLSMALAALVILPVSSLAPGHTGPPPAAAFVNWRMQDAPVLISLSAPLHPGPASKRSLVQGSAPHVSPSISVGHRASGAIAPSSATLRLQVVAPSGQVLYENGTGFGCSGQGADLLPKDGPVRAAC